MSNSKCIQHIKSMKVLRVSNQIAGEKVDTGEWNYCTKSVYKRIKAQKEGGDKNTSK